MTGEVVSLELTDGQIDVITEFMEKYPITAGDIENHHAMMCSNDSRRFESSVGRAQRVVPPPPSVTETMMTFRTSLPAFNYRSQILESIAKHDVTLITGGTGCGKTTQVPQFLLEQAHITNTPVRIMCTQPRRLSTVAIAKRVAQERGESLGRAVGFNIRLEQKLSVDTALLYCTSGVLLRILTSYDAMGDITHVILDEVHEREQNTDYLLIALKQALRKRDNLKVILMSATMQGDLDLFKNYFDSHTVHVDIPSKLYHVEKFDLADVLSMTDFFAKLPQAPTPALRQFERSVVVGEFVPNCRSASALDESPTTMTTAAVTNQSSSMGSSQRDMSPDMFGEATDRKIGGFGFQHGRRNNLEEPLKHLNRVLPNRPKSFDPCFTERLRRSEVRRSPLVDTHMNIGGCKFADLVDVELVCRTIIYCMDSPVKGAILVFLPGYDDIMATNDRLQCLLQNETRTLASVFMLHSQINPGDQHLVFGTVPLTHRKVILSTNIAEASVTIDDVVFVIDSGKVKEKTYEHSTRISQLRMQWIAKSNAEQRSGRAGRCRNGYCFRLYSQIEYERFMDTQVPEIRRSAIYDVCLHAKIFAPKNMSVRAFLQMAPEPPAPDAVKQSLDFLEQLGALHAPKRDIPRRGTSVSQFIAARVSMLGAEPRLTCLGRLMAFLPIDPQLTRLLVFGIVLQCFNPIVTLVAALSYRDPFILPMDDEKRGSALGVRDEFARNDYSDHLMLIRMFNAYASCMNRQRDFCNDNFLSIQTMKLIYGIRKQLIQELHCLNMVPPTINRHDSPMVNRFSDCWPIIQAAIVAGCYPGIGVVHDGMRMRKIRTSGGHVHIHPSCVFRRHILRRQTALDVVERALPSVEFVAFQELFRINHRVMLKTATVVPPLSVFLFSGLLQITKEHAEFFEIAFNPAKDISKKRKSMGKKSVFINPWYVPKKLENGNTVKSADKGTTNATGDEKTPRSAEKRRNKNGRETFEAADPSLSDETSADSSQSFSLSSTRSFEHMSFNVEMDSFLTFNTPFVVAQTALRIRFKLISYVLSVLKNPHNIANPNNELLDCLAVLLTLEHKRKSFRACEDLRKH